MYSLFQEVFFVSGPYVGLSGTITRTDGAIPNFPYRVSVGTNVRWMSDADFVALPDGFHPGWGQGNINPDV